MDFLRPSDVSWRSENVRGRIIDKKAACNMSCFQKRHVMLNHFCLYVPELPFGHWSLSPLVWWTLKPANAVGIMPVTSLSARPKGGQRLTCPLT
ncbi:hypothetical protein TNCV_1256981 [Trichonephila clavipes]|nr:hypothetical protein TNCV_1256981 [Trichonephila clavipes]